MCVICIQFWSYVFVVEWEGKGIFKLFVPAYVVVAYLITLITLPGMTKKILFTPQSVHLTRN